MTDATPVNLGLIIIGIAVLVGIISLFYFDQSQDLILKTNTTTNNSDLNKTIKNNTLNESNLSIIKILNTGFYPKEIIIKKGETINWINEDNAPHTVTSDSGIELGSGILLNKENYSNKFDFDGTYEYYCNFHKELKGKVIVENE